MRSSGRTRFDIWLPAVPSLPIDPFLLLLQQQHSAALSSSTNECIRNVLQRWTEEIQTAAAGIGSRKHGQQKVASQTARVDQHLLRLALLLQKFMRL